jgi:hypothetical protein
MSHTMNIKTEIKDLEALRAACERLNIGIAYSDNIHLFSTTEKGAAIFLKDWRFPVVIRDDGTIALDNYGGAWGDMAELNKLTAYYGIEKAKLEAWKHGHTVTEGYNDETQELTLEINLEG